MAGNKATPAGASRGAPIDLTDDEPVTPARTKGGSSSMASSQTTRTNSSPSVSAKKRKTQHDGNGPPQPAEKRLRQYRPGPPKTFHDIYERALSQRFYILQRSRGGTEECPTESFELTGSTGNIYTVEIQQRPSCSCPHALKGNQCKHVIYVLARVLQAPFEYVYQLALLSPELRAIFDSAPTVKAQSGSNNGNRKAVDGDCPICFCAFDAKSPESIVWCRAACGQNIHQECFEMWAKTKVGDVTCPFCRSKWEGDADMVSRVKRDQGVQSEGYVNVASQLGISTVRDTSTYSDWYEYQQRRRYWGQSGYGRGRGGRR